MLFSDLVSLGSFVSSLAVLISVAFLYFQMREMTEQTRQSVKHARAQTAQARADRFVDYQMRAAENPALAIVIRRGLSGDETMSEDELSQFTAWCRGVLMDLWESFVQHREGLLQDSFFHTMTRGLPNLMGTPGMQLVWRSARSIYEPAYVEFMNEIVERGQAAGSAPVNMVQTWREGIARIKAMNSGALPAAEEQGPKTVAP